MATEFLILHVIEILVILTLTTLSLVWTSPISKKLEIQRASPPRMSSFPYDLDSSLISFPKFEESYNLQKENEILNSKSRLQRYPSMIIFDEDYDEPLAPEPVFKTEILFYPPRPDITINRKVDNVKIKNQNQKPYMPPNTTPRLQPSSATPRVKLIPQKTVFQNLSTVTPKPSYLQMSLLTTTNKRIVNSALTTTMPIKSVTTRKSIKSSECEERLEGDCDEILIEGSFYTPFKVHPPVPGP